MSDMRDLVRDADPTGKEEDGAVRIEILVPTEGPFDKRSH